MVPCCGLCGSVLWSMWFRSVVYVVLCGSGLWSMWFSVLPVCGLGGSLWFCSLVDVVLCGSVL